MIDRLLRWIELPIRGLFWLSILCGMLMMLHVAADVTGRTVFNRPLPGTNEIVAGWYMVAIAYFPWAHIAQRNEHIVAGVFQNIGTPRFSYWLDVVVKFVTALYLSLFIWQTTKVAVNQTRAGEVVDAGGVFVPVWQTRWILPIAGTVMCLYLILRVIADCMRGYRPEAATPAPVEARL